MRLYRLSTVIVLLVLSMSFTQTLFAEKGGNVSVFFGSKQLEADWDPIGTQAELGIKFDMQVAEDSPISFAFDILSSNDTKTEYDSNLADWWTWTGSTVEKNIGIRIRKEHEGISVFSGLGISLIDATFTGEIGGATYTDSGNGTGLWFEVGVNYIKDDWNVGLDLISSRATATLVGLSGNVGGLHLGIFIGTHW
jgi:hypothetical protein